MRRLGVILAFALVTVIAHAAPSEIIRVEYATTPGCPSAEAFVDQVRARSPRIRVGTGSERARTLVVRITSRHRRITGRLTVRELDGSEAERTVVGDSCSDVASGLALIAAVAIDPTASTTTPALAPTASATPTASSGTAAATPENATPPTAPDAGTPAPPPDRPPVEPPKPEPPAPPAPAVEAPASKSREARADGEANRPSWQLSFGAHGEVASGALPNVLVTIPVFFEVARVSQSLLAPAARLRFERAGSGVVGAGAGSAQFTWTAGSLDVCPIAWSRASLRLTPCVRTEAGVLEAAGVNVLPARRGARPWWTVGPVARARLVVLGPAFIELEAALPVAIVRDRFFLEPGETVFRPPPVGGSASAGIGVSIW